ncbi:hypothetical protein KR093_001389, partial [Drosophila rubida]
KDVTKDKLDLTLLETPSIQLELSIKSFDSFRILGKFTEKTLIIVKIKDTPIHTGISNFLPYLLKELHELNIVFITDHDPIIWLKDLFVYCFREGFVNSLVIYHHNETTSLYSYNPYPEIREKKISQVDEFLNRRRLLRNLHQFQIRTISFIIEPRMIHYTNRKGKHVHAGYMYNVMLEFIRRHNATLKILTEKHIQGIAHVTDVMIPSKEIDFVCYPKEPNWNVSNTIALYVLNSKIIVPYAQPLAKFWYFAKPFTRITWLAVLATTAYGTIMLYGSDRSGFGVHLLSIWCHLLFLPQPRISINNWQQFVIHFILFLSGFVLTNMYTSVLKSMLTSGLFEPQFHSLEDLKHAPYQLMIIQYYADFYKDRKMISDELIRKYYICSSEELDTNRAKLNISFMYITYEDRLDCLLYQQHLLKVPRFKKIQESVRNGLMSFPVAPSLPYLNMLNTYLRRIFESGIFQKMMSDSCRDSIESGICNILRNEPSGHNSFNLEFYLLAIALWVIGLSVASLCFLLELLIMNNVKQ